ncbi:hypothetical protein [Nocardioides alcanivorans]|uniref:hypothetical protein n=1 Tax=Nocardioides alcanivorans TaxID=2897352 RepID=UPI001F2FA363|nr:hypothetical protein [Nocardioides alcanivorans]
MRPTVDNSKGRALVRRVHLHIGLPKTGTTYLQLGLWQHQEELAHRGVLLPGRHQRRHLLASLDFRDDPKLASRPGDVSQPWRDLVDEIASWTGEAAVVSHEFFAPATVEQIRRGVEQLAPAEVHVVLTARPMTELAPSRWQEWVKNGGRKGIDDYPPRADYDPHDAWGWGSFDLADVLDRWSQVVPPERIHVLPTSGAGAPPDEIWGRFTDVIGVPGARLLPPDRKVNERLGLVQVEALRRVNEQLRGFSEGYDRGRWIRGYLASSEVMPAGRRSPTVVRRKPGPAGSSAAIVPRPWCVTVASTYGEISTGSFRNVRCRPVGTPTRSTMPSSCRSPTR